MHTAMLAGVLAACSGGPREPAAPSETAADTAVPPTAVGEADCVLTKENTLRAVCTVHVDPPQPIQIAFGPADGFGPDRVHVSEQVTSTHTVDLYIMPPNTQIAWTAQAVDGLQLAKGRFSTGVVPEGSTTSLKQRPGGAPPWQLLGLASACRVGAVAVLLGPSSRVVWYEDLTERLGSLLEAVTFTEDRTVLALVDDGIFEVDLMGRRLLTLPSEDLPVHVHHDVFRRDGLTYVLFNETVKHDEASLLVDGVLVLDAAGAEVARWRLADHLPDDPAISPGLTTDYSHANSVWVDAAGDILVSFRHLDTVIKLDGVAADTFGAIRWRLAGGPDAALGSDFTGPVDFQAQHNVHLEDDGRMIMLDNRALPQESSSILVLELDEGARTVAESERHTLPLHCAFQGSAWRTESGVLIAGCAPPRRMFAFNAEDGSLFYDAELVCEGDQPSFAPRVIPLSW